VNFFIGENLVVGEEDKFLPRRAVDATEVATIGDGDSQIVDRTLEGIRKATHEDILPAAKFSMVGSKAATSARNVLLLLSIM
jgi:hypothetical protein